MLEKLGWKPGSGLGLHASGTTSHIQIKYKQDNLGLGASKQSINNWLGNTSAFEDLLGDLNARCSTTSAESTDVKIEKTEETEEKKEEEKPKPLGRL